MIYGDLMVMNPLVNLAMQKPHLQIGKSTANSTAKGPFSIAMYQRVIMTRCGNYGENGIYDGI